MTVTTPRTPRRQEWHAGPEGWAGRVLTHYRIVRPVGRGTQGLMFEAEDVVLRRPVALKVLPTRFARGERSDAIDRFLREVRMAGAIEHPHVVPVLEADEDRGYYFAVFAWIEGEAVGERVRRDGPLDPATVAKLGQQAAQGLAAAHRMGILHRDLSPENLLIGRDGSAHLADFGLAGAAADADANGGYERVYGSIGYSAPEVLASGVATPASDQFALAASMLYALTGQAPYPGETLDQVLSLRRQRPAPPAAADCCPGLPAWFADALDRALATEPDQRFPRLERFAHALADPANPTLPTTARVAPPPPRIAASTDAAATLPAPLKPDTAHPTPAPRRRFRVALAAAITLLAITACALWQYRPVVVTAAPSVQVVPNAPAPTPGEADRIDWATLPPAGVVRATDTQTLRQIIKAGDLRAFAIEGTLTRAEVSDSGQRVVLTFDGVAPDGFQAVYFARLQTHFAERFDTPTLDPLHGRAVRIMGTVQEFLGRPQVLLRTRDQLQPLPTRPAQP